MKTMTARDLLDHDFIQQIANIEAYQVTDELRDEILKNVKNYSQMDMFLRSIANLIVGLVIDKKELGKV